MVIYFSYLYFFFKHQFGFDDRENLLLAALIGLLEAPDVRLGIGRSAASGSRAVGRLRFARRRSRRGEPGETVPMVSEPLTEPAHDALRVPASPADDTPAATPPETR